MARHPVAVRRARRPVVRARLRERHRTTRPAGRRRSARPGPADRSPSARMDGDGTRIVWRYSADDEQRTFTITYRMTRLVKVYRDIAELNLRVWGDQWTTPLGHLTSDVTLPEGGRRVTVRLPARVGTSARRPGRGRAQARPGRRHAAGLRDPGAAMGRAARRVPARRPEVDGRSDRAAACRGRGAVRRSDARERGRVRADPRRGGRARRGGRTGGRARRADPPQPVVDPADGRARRSSCPAVFVFLWIASRYGRDRRGGPEITTCASRRPTTRPRSSVRSCAKAARSVRTSSSRRSSTSSDGSTSSPSHETVEHKTWLGTEDRGHQRPAREERGRRTATHCRRGTSKVYDVDQRVPAGRRHSSSPNFGDELKARAKVFYGDFQDWQEKVADEVRTRRWIDKRGKLPLGRLDRDLLRRCS